MKKKEIVGLTVSVILLVVLCGCERSQLAAAPSPPQVGGDRDAHGCIGSAGYRWCAREGACVRPWELAAAKGFPSSEEAVNAWCSAQP
jgi:hypothetical protein